MKPELARDSWSNYRRGFIKDDCEIFDEAANRERLNIWAIAFTTSPDPVEGALLSILLESEKDLRECELDSL